MQCCHPKSFVGATSDLNCRKNNSLSFIFIVAIVILLFLFSPYLCSEQDWLQETRPDNETKREVEFQKDQSSQIFAEVCNLVDLELNNKITS